MSSPPSLAAPPAPLMLRSTNGASLAVDFPTALLQGQAPDGGLYLPDALPRFSREELASLRAQPYAAVAAAVLTRLVHGAISASQQAALCADAYDFPVPIESVDAQRFILRLDRGPTASFKDFAARMMARWMSVLRPADAGALTILTATSGDTGSAVAHAYHRVPGIRVVVLFPEREVSERQRKQMTTLGDNITACAVHGTFDECQALVKHAFGDAALAHLPLTSANSINIGRLLPQAVYYVYSYVNTRAAAAGEPVIFSIPSGNFGNLLGCVLAKRMGVPIARIVAATNANDAFPQFLATGRYARIAPSRNCLSNAMNVGHPSNLARLVALYGGWLDQRGDLKRAPDLDALRRDIFAVGISDAETRRTMQKAWQEHDLLLEPHGAVGWAGLGALHAAEPATGDIPALSLETAHPAKFPESVTTATGHEPDLPPSLEHLADAAEHVTPLAATPEALTELLSDGGAPSDRNRGRVGAVDRLPGR